MNEQKVIPSFWSIWLMASRPKTLTVGFSPVLIGTAMAVQAGTIYLGYFFLTLLFAIGMQIGCNFANDYSDGVRGTDAERKGPLRVIQAGFVSPQQMQKAICCVFAFVLVVGALISIRIGWEFMGLVVICILAALTYTGGPKPYGYLGLGEPVVLVFFGIVSVCMTYYIQNLAFSWEVLVASIGPGAMATALVSINNFRDMKSDKKAQKMTLAVRYGTAFARGLYAGLIVLALIVVPFVLYFGLSDHSFVLLTCFLMFPAYKLIQAVYANEDEVALNDVFQKTAKLALLHGVVFSVLWQF